MTKLTVSTIVNASLEKVWKVWTSPEDIMQWNFASDDWCCPSAANDIQTGGNFSWRMAAKDGSFAFDFSGKYDLVEPMSKIAYTLGEFKEHFVPAGRQVEVLFEKVSDNQTKVTEIFDAEEVHSDEMQVAGRQAILENFKKHVEAPTG